MDKATSIYQTIDLFPATGSDPAAVGREMPNVKGGWPYQTAEALNELGPGAESQMSQADWEAVTQRLKAASVDSQMLSDSQQGAPLSYTIWELAWADRMNKFLTADERTELLSIAQEADLLSGIDSDMPDVYDVEVTVEALDILGGLDSGTSVAGTDLFSHRGDLCVADDDDSRTQVLTMSSIPSVESPCTAEQVDAAWRGLADAQVALTSASTDWSGDMNSAAILALEQSREMLWPSDTDRVSAVDLIFTNDARMISTMGTDAMLYLSQLQKTGFLMGKSVSLTDQQRQMAASEAVAGSDTASERLTGVNMAEALSAARALGMTVSLSPGFLASLHPLERIAVASAQGQDAASMEEWLTDVADTQFSAQEDRIAVLGVVSPVLLAAPESVACSSNGLQAVKAALGQSGTLDLQLSTVAMGMRIMERCGESVPADWRGTLLSSATDLYSSGQDMLSLSSIWEATRIRCAIDPSSADVGETVWPQMQTYVSPDGAAISPEGFLSLDATYEVLSIVTTTTAQCTDTGVMDARSL